MAVDGGARSHPSVIQWRGDCVHLCTLFSYSAYTPAYIYPHLIKMDRGVHRCTQTVRPGPRGTDGTVVSL